MIKIIKNTLFIIAFGTGLSLFAQQSIDTVNLALGLQSMGLHKEAYSLLGKYRMAHPDDVNIEWLYGQSAFYLGKQKAMMLIYEDNIRKHQDNYYLQLDYAFKLAESGKYRYSEELLHQYLETDTANDLIYSYLAKTAIWQKDFNTAIEHINKAILYAPNKKEYKDLKQYIIEAKAPWIYIDANYYSDNQPMILLSPVASAGMYINRYLMPNISLHSRFADTSGTFYSAQWIKAGNTSYFAVPRITFKADIGAFVYPNKTTKLTGMLNISRPLLKHLNLALQAEHKPYLLRPTSLDSALMIQDLSATASWNDANGFNGQAAYLTSFFDEGNTVSTASAWLVSPPLKLWKFALHAGYGFSYTTSKKDTWSPIKSYDELFEDIYNDSYVAGQFESYITPMEQQVHSIVAVFSFAPVNRLSLSTTCSYGFNASIQTPYMYGYYNEDSEVEIVTIYAKETFHPLNINAKIAYKISNILTVTVNYMHSSPNYYYKTDYASIGIKMNIINGKEK